MSHFARWFQIAWSIGTHWLTRYIASWVLLLVVTAAVSYAAWNLFNFDRRDDKNNGHATIDFGGQWFCGKLLLRGEAQYLYERHHQWSVMKEFYPGDTEPFYSVRVDRYRLEDWRAFVGRNPDHIDPKTHELLASYLLPLGARDNTQAALAALGGYEAVQPNRREFGNPWFKRDAEALMSWLLGNDDEASNRTAASCLLPLAARDGIGAVAIVAAGQDQLWNRRRMARAAAPRPGGNFYPPIHAFWYAPLALLPPPESYRVTMIVLGAFAFLAGLGITKISQGRIWWPIATLFVIIFPGVYSAQALGHSSIVILTLLIWGYYYFQRNADVRGGMLWGLIAYKPTWAVIYFGSLVIVRRWKAALVMGLCGVAQILLTIPIVGVDTWRTWFDVSRDGATWYNKDSAWVRCSRDLNALPRQLLVDFRDPEARPDRFEINIITYILIAFFFEATVRLATLRVHKTKRWSPAGAAFLLTGLWMCCWRITYYDTLLVALPAALLLCTPSAITEPFFWRRTRREVQFRGHTIALPQRNFGWVCNPLVVVLLPLMVWDTAWESLPVVLPCFALLWLWAGWLWLRLPDPPAPAAQPASAPQAAGDTAAAVAAAPPRVTLATHPS